MSQKQTAKGTKIEYSIVVPTYKEAKNIPKLAKRVFEALDTNGILNLTEMIIVDDNSKDGTVEAVEKLKASGSNISLIVRTNERGLSSAVIAGFNAAKGQVLLCMDADLQHPPESVPSLLKAIDKGAEFAIGTRYGKKGLEIDKDWPLIRQVISKGARLLAYPLTPLSDPMTGFFAIKADRFRKNLCEIWDIEKR